MADVTRREAVQLAAATGLAALGASVVHADHEAKAALAAVEDLKIYLSIEKGVNLKSESVVLMGGKSYQSSDPGFPFKWVHDMTAKRYRLSLAPYASATLLVEDKTKAFTTIVVASKGCQLHVTLFQDDKAKNADLCCLTCDNVTVCDVPPFWIDCHGWVACCIG